MSTVSKDYFLFPAEEGLGRPFFATDEEIHEILDSSLPKKFEPYILVTSKWTRRKKEFIVVDIEDFMKLRKENFVHFYIVSKKISLQMDFSNPKTVVPTVEAHGVILLDHGYVSRKFGWYSSFIGHVFKSVNRKTGEEKTHSEYAEICTALCKAVGDRLSHAAACVTADGRIVPYDGVRMTDGFVAAVRSGNVTSSFVPRIV